MPVSKKVSKKVTKTKPVTVTKKKPVVLRSVKAKPTPSKKRIADKKSNSPLHRVLIATGLKKRKGRGVSSSSGFISLPKSRQKRIVLLGVVSAFALTATILTILSFASTVTLARVEAEKMPNIPSSASVSPYWVTLWSSATLSGDFTVASAADKITVRAKGDQCAGAPQMTVRVGDKEIMAQSVTATGLTDYTAAVALPAGKHSISISFSNDYWLPKNCDRNLYIDKFTVYGTTVDPIVETAGYSGKLWNIPTIVNDVPPTIPTSTPTASRTDAEIKFAWGAGSPATGINTDSFVGVWTGNKTFEAANYTFTATSDDGVRVYVDNLLVIDQWKRQSITTVNATKAMTAGVHQIKVEYYDQVFDATLNFSYVKATTATPIPTPTPTPTPAPNPTPVVATRGAKDTNRGNSGALRTFYVDGVNGNDAYNGTSPATAWRTLSKVNSFAAIPGDAILFKAGQAFIGSLNPDSGNATNRTIYGSYADGGSTAGRAIIRQTAWSSTGVTTAMSVGGKAWLHIRDLVIEGTNTTWSYSSGQWLIQGGGQANNLLFDNITVQTCGVCMNGGGSENTVPDPNVAWEIKNSTIGNAGGTAIYYYGKNLRIYDSIVHDWSQRGDPGGAAQHGIYSRGRELDAQRNEFYSPGSVTPRDMGQALSPRSRDNIIAYNYIHDTVGIMIGHFPDTSTSRLGTGRSLIHHNIGWNNKQGNARLLYVGSNGGALTENWAIYNNTLYSSLTTSGSAVGSGGSTGRFVIRNNALAGVWTVSNGVTVTESNNQRGTLAALGLPAVPTSGIWSAIPVSTSPLINAGTATIDTGISLTGFKGTAPDVGAIEVQ
jgi:hypothetical protein